MVTVEGLQDRESIPGKSKNFLLQYKITPELF
jgi:hypothetical protein